MHIVKLEKHFDYSADAVRQKWDDFSGIYKFHPLIDSSPIVSDVKNGLGTERACYFHDGNKLKEKVVEYNANERRMTLSMNAEFMPIKNASAQIHVISLSDSKAKVEFQLSFEPKYGVLGAVLTSLAIKPKIKAMLAQLLGGLDTHMATGEVI